MTANNMYSNKKKIALVGGAGYVGKSLSITLKQKGCIILVIDVILVSMAHLSDIDCYRKCDIQNEKLLTSILEIFQPDVVVHLASWGMSGSPMLNARCHQINVEGTAALINAMRTVGCRNLIYTSTYNVCFGGKEIVDGDEDTPYFLLEEHVDQYSPSKRRAEELVLNANSQALRTMSLRPAAIYGEEEVRHFPRIVSHMDSGIFLFKIGGWSLFIVIIKLCLLVCLFVSLFVLFLYLNFYSSSLPPLSIS